MKQLIPPVHPGMIARSRLEDRLRDATTKLTVVVAPAGWGKTSLLSRWASADDSGARVAWLSLDESDDEPIRFWNYILTALSQVSDEVGPAANDLLLASSDGPMAHALPVLLNELAASSTKHILVLDDFQVISDRDVHESFEFLLAYLPPTLRVVIGSRADPPLPLARMRVRGELTELRADDLRLNLDESAAMVTAVSESAIDVATATAVWERTEGWAAGLRLAGLALRGGPDHGLVVGDQRHLFDYFEQEVLPALEPAQRDLLVRAAPLEFLSGSLCDAALAVEGSAAVLAELESAELFVVALDGGHEWYRCHHLLRDALLRAGLPQSRQDERDVLRRAASWFEAHDRVDDAVRHLLRAGDSDRASDLLTPRLPWFLERGWGSAYLELGERLPEAAVGPHLALTLAYAADVSGHVERVAAWLDVCEQQLQPDTVVSERWRDARAGVLALRGVLGTPASEAARTVELCERAVAMESAAGNDQNPEALAALGRAYVLDGRFADAAGLLAESWRRREEFGWSVERALQVASQLSLALLALARDEELDSLLQEAGAVVDAAERDWGTAPTAQVATLVRLVQGRRSYQRGDLDRAVTELATGLTLAGLSSRPTYIVLGLIFHADVDLATGHRRDAQETLVRARETAENDPIAPFVRGWLEEAESRVGRVAVRAAADQGALFEEITDREMSILRMLPGTATQREIGAALFLSINTIKAYNKSLYRKLDVGSRAEAVQTARRLGLI
ncbi:MULTISPECIES: helix-turn-helix transcriptional regulator [unclassified Nocardioides]|uniref:helix-turn-helix transcriptional regulator n=1 Tax=unclassified Nocardioides TaxID=2615069 RepID=UPI0019107B60|nr:MULTISPECIES: LuxR C-terminal-related transcriptional regulator [unclassified Nocardioides]